MSYRYSAWQVPEHPAARGIRPSRQGWHRNGKLLNGGQIARADCAVIRRARVTLITGWLEPKQLSPLANEGLTAGTRGDS